jgi:hypothetical protein
MAAKMIMPKRAPRPKKVKEDPTPGEISDTACRVGMICGLLMGVSERACLALEKMDPKEYIYFKETKAVRALRRKLMGGRKK